MNLVIEQIADKHGLKLVSASPLSGGDINDVFLLKCSSESLVLKLNIARRYPGMFEAEANGLRLLASSESFRIPEVMAHGIHEANSYLLLEFIPKGNQPTDFWGNFAEKLARLHRTTAPNFGLKYDNYIGSLPQHNEHRTNAGEFYISQRLEPQLKMAVDGGFKLGSLHNTLTRIDHTIPKEVPALVHGDLWSGNYLVSDIGAPVLIDPAVAFAPREMDLAMMQLFGGFPSEVFALYHEHFPLAADWQERVPLWQLYYLLVHLNLFGSGYLPRVKDILDRYTS
ncbi:MAG: fructosamine kinase family protein [Bacteroidota bacterium]